MPTYDYECQACGHAFEKLQMMSDKLLRKCPKCGARKLARLIGSGGGLIFKGSGFYSTDYRGKGYADAAKADADSGAGGAAKEGGAKDEGAGKDSASAGSSAAEKHDAKEAKGSAAKETTRSETSDRASSKETKSSKDSRPSGGPKTPTGKDPGNKKHPK